jgi:hypothetical protein
MDPREENMPKAKRATTIKQYNGRASDFNCGWSVSSLLGNLSFEAKSARPASSVTVSKPGDTLAQAARVNSLPIDHRHPEYL